MLIFVNEKALSISRFIYTLGNYKVLYFMILSISFLTIHCAIIARDLKKTGFLSR